MRTLASCAAAALLGVLNPTAGWPQAAAPAVPSSSGKTVYLVEIAQTEEITTSNLTVFATKFLELRLSRGNGIEIVRVPVIPPCKNSLSAGQESKGQLQQGTPSQETSFYVVQAFIEAHRADSPAQSAQKEAAPGDQVLDYELIKVTDCRPALVFRRSETFTEHSVLDALNTASNLLAVRLDAELRPSIDVAEVILNSDGKDQREISKVLLDALVERIAFGNAFQPRDLRQVDKQSGYTPSGYKLETRLMFTRAIGPHKIFEGKFPGQVSDVEATFSIVVSDPLSSGTTHTYLIAPTLKSSLSDRDRLYAQAGQAVALGLEEFRSAQAAGLKDKLDALEKDTVVTLSALEAAVLLPRAKEFLCIDAESSCSVHADAALPLLTQLNQRPSDQANPAEVLPLLAQVQFLTGQYRKAGENFEAVLKQYPPSTPPEKAALYIQAGDAWSKGQSYGLAAIDYREALKLQASPEVQIKLARSLRFNGERLAALDTLLSAKTAPNANLELGDLVKAFSDKELPDAVAHLENAHDATLAPILTTAYNRLVRNCALQGDYQQAAQTAERWVQQRYAQPGENLLQSDELLSSINHKIKADERTKQIFDEILAQNPADVSALVNNMFVCTEYLKDFQCAFSSAVRLEHVLPPQDYSLALDVAEAYVLIGRHVEAEQRMRTLTANSGLDPNLRPIADFYLAWSLLALNRGEDASRAANEWKSHLTRVRNLKARIPWVFQGAETALARARIPDDKKGVLAQMITAMTDSDRALPNPF